MFDFCNSLLENQKLTARLELENSANVKLYYRVRPIRAFQAKKEEAVPPL
jgi:hypothetical protein